MSLPVSERSDAIQRALALIGDLCGDEWLFRVGAKTIAPAQPFLTTLEELREKGYIKRVVHNSDEPFQLTAEGWFAAQAAAGRFASIEFEARKARLLAAMKGYVKGRDRDVLVDWRELAKAANVPASWLWGLLDTQALYRLDPRSRYRIRFEKGTVWITSTFGLDPA